MARKQKERSATKEQTTEHLSETDARRMAIGSMPLNEMFKWNEHLGGCLPCQGIIAKQDAEVKKTRR